MRGFEAATEPAYWAARSYPERNPAKQQLVPGFRFAIWRFLGGRAPIKAHRPAVKTVAASTPSFKDPGRTHRGEDRPADPGGKGARPCRPDPAADTVLADC